MINYNICVWGGGGGQRTRVTRESHSESPPHATTPAPSTQSLTDGDGHSKRWNVWPCWCCANVLVASTYKYCSWLPAACITAAFTRYTRVVDQPRSEEIKVRVQSISQIMMYWNSIRG